MTEKQYFASKAKGVKIYKIYLIGSTLHKVLMSYVYFDNRWISTGWINSCTPYDASLHVYFRYVSEDQFEKQLDKYFKDLKKEHSRIIREETTALNKLNRAINKYLKIQETTA